MAVQVILVAMFGKLCEALAKGAYRIGKQAIEQVLVDAVTGEMEALNSIDGKLERIMSKAMRNGLDYIYLAQRPQTNQRQRISFLEKARDQFIDARNVDIPLNSARATTYVGSCCELLSEPSLDFYEQAYNKLCSLEQHYYNSDPIRDETLMKLVDCKFNFSRRYFVSSTMDLVDFKRWSGGLAGLFGYKPAISNIPEVYDYLRPLCLLLKARNTSIKDLRDPSRLTKEGIADFYIKRYEKICGIAVR